MNLPPFPFVPASPEERLRLIQYGEVCARAELERCAAIADDEARIRSEAGMTHPEDSAARDRCFAGARAATNVGRGIRSGEIVGAECARAYKDDAERYRWLRDRLAIEDVESLHRDFWGTPDEAESVKTDAAIDAARESAIPAKDGQECPK